MDFQYLGSALLCILPFIALVAILFSDIFFGSSKELVKESPLEILRKKYATAEISTEAYEERKSVLEREIKK